MHPGQVEVDVELVQALLRAQHPRWAQLSVRPLPSGGTVNAIFRVGERLTARFPLTATGVDAIGLEARWLPELAPLLPMRIPMVVACGEPAAGYPFHWAVHRWIDGSPLVEGGPGDNATVARELATFVRAMRAIELPDGPPAHRSMPLTDEDAEVRAALASLRATDEALNVDAILARWTSCMGCAAGDVVPGWIHSDLMPSNLLGSSDGLTAVIDFGAVGLGDPAVDLIPAWNLLTASARDTFREAVQVDDETWERGRGWALSMAAIQLPYYRMTNPVISANTRFVLSQILTD